MAAQFEEKTFTSQDGLKLYYRDYGDPIIEATPVLCLPGLTRNSKDFAGLAERLSDTRRVLCPDLRGRGQSDRDPNFMNYQVPTYVNDVFSLMIAANVHQAAFIGTSLGGLVSMAFATSKPTMMKGIVLNDIGPEIDPRGLARIAGYVGKTTPVTSWEQAANQVKELNGAIYPEFTDADWMNMARNTFRDSAQGTPETDYDPKISEAMAKAAPQDPWALFRATKAIPGLVVRGAISDVLSEETLAKMIGEKPDLQKLIVPNVGHVPMLEQEPSYSAIDDFLRQLDQKGHRSQVA